MSDYEGEDFDEPRAHSQSPDVRPSAQSTRPRNQIDFNRLPFDHTTNSSNRIAKLDAYHVFRERPDQPDGVYELSTSYEAFLRHLPETDRSPYQIAHKTLENIAEVSEAFVKAPDDDTNRIEIWGNDEQVERAKIELRAWEMHTHANRPGPSWPKTKAFDGRQESRQMQATIQKFDDETFAKYNTTYFDFEAYLIWPKNYDVEGYRKEYDAGVIRDIEKSFRCRITHEAKRDSRYVKIQAGSEDELLAVYQRLINLAKEMTARKNQGLHRNLINLPSAESYRDQVEVIMDHKLNVNRAGLNGTPLEESKVSEWPAAVQGVARANREEIRQSIDQFIQEHVNRSQTHIRLRVNFGELDLITFRKSAIKNLVYEIDDFFGMIQHSRTQLSDCILRGGDDKNMYQLVDTISALEQFHYLQRKYVVQFHFRGKDRRSKLMLELEMEPVAGLEDELDVSSQRWLTSKDYSRNESILGLKVFDLNYPGYMIRADGYDIFTNQAALRDMAQFRNEVRFTPAKTGLRAAARRRSTFPRDQTDLVAVTEITIEQFHFKDNFGIFELLREDTYNQTPHSKQPFPDLSSWKASYHYPEWDNMMDSVANMKPGEKIRWKQDLKSFFPEDADPDDARALPRGFKKFMQEVGEIQTLLGHALAELPIVEGQ